MNKYVELSAVQKKIMERIGDVRGTYLAKDIGKIPAADVQEIKHAKWELLNKNQSRCSNCGLVRNIETQVGWKFCPMCGAKIDLEEK